MARFAPFTRFYQIYTNRNFINDLRECSCKTLLMHPLTLLKYFLPVCLLTLVIGHLSTTWRQLEQEIGEVEKVGDARVLSGPRGTFLNRPQLSPRLTQNVSSAVSTLVRTSEGSSPMDPATPSFRQKDSALSSQRLESLDQSGREPSVSEVSAVSGSVTPASVEQVGVISSPGGVTASASASSASSAGGLSQNPPMGAVNASPTQSSVSSVPESVHPSASAQAPDPQQKDAGINLQTVPDQVSSQSAAGVSTLGKESMGHGGSPYPLGYEVYKQQYGAQALNAQIFNASSQ